MAYWGYHLMVDAAGCDLEKITDKANIEAFTKELVKRIDMVAYGKPRAVRFGTGNKAGYTLVQLIETSNICAHFVEDNDNGGQEFYFDVFSCKPFDQEAVVKTLQEYFGMTKYNITYIERQAPRD